MPFINKVHLMVGGVVCDRTWYSDLQLHFTLWMPNCWCKVPENRRVPSPWKLMTLQWLFLSEHDIYQFPSSLCATQFIYRKIFRHNRHSTTIDFQYCCIFKHDLHTLVKSCKVSFSVSFAKGNKGISSQYMAFLFPACGSLKRCHCIELPVILSTEPPKSPWKIIFPMYSEVQYKGEGQSVEGQR